MIPPRPIPEYPSLMHESHWQMLLKLSQTLLERLQNDYDRPDPEQFQAVVHLIQTLVPGHLRKLH